jgi:hypothetical protein
MSADVYERREREAEAAFVKRLVRGRQVELQVAMQVAPLGVWLRMGRLFVAMRENARARREVRARGETDIEVEGGHRLEVKARPFAFTSVDDYPYPTAYVGSCARWETRTDIPCSVVIVSEPTGEFVVAPTVWREGWEVERPYATDRGFHDPSLAVPRALLRPAVALFDHLTRPCPLGAAT